MLKIELVPDLSHCIEMVAKREHAAVFKQILAPRQGNKELEGAPLFVRGQLGHWFESF